MGGIAADSSAVNQQRVLMQMQMQDRAAHAGTSSFEADLTGPNIFNYMQMEGRVAPGGFLQQGAPLGAPRQLKDSKKSEWQLSAEVNELKQQRNKDLEHIKILKVELQKLELVFKKYKECLSPDNVPQV